MIDVQQKDLIDQMITVLTETVEAKDLYTNGHSMRVAGYAREIAHRMGESEEYRTLVYHVGLLHDVGKIRVPDTIINKKGKLTREEYDQIKLHTVAGYHILKQITAIPELATGARWHHERWDGRGYPNGLKGSNIPKIARIISVADSYDAMTSNRSYREIMPQEMVREEIRKNSGSQFDPEAAEVMLEMIDDDKDYVMRQTQPKSEPTVLLIDDSDTVHNIVAAIFKDEKYDVIDAYSGEEAMEIMKNRRVPLVLLDIEMPDINGFDVMRWIKENSPSTKVIFLTGNTDLESIMTGENLGISDYVTKPIFPNYLKESVNSILRHYR